jgi:glycoside hydrolase-like protein
VHPSNLYCDAMRLTPRLAISLLSAALGCSGKIPTEVENTLEALSGAVPNVPKAVAELSGSALLKQVTDSGPYLGFDTFGYPGDGAMQSWRAHADYDWVGFYLPAPCHKDDSWSGKRATIEAMGWGVAVVYVGQQTWGKTPRAGGRMSTGVTCATNLVSGEQGKRDAADAVARTTAEGFPNGTAIFLDIEHMNTVPNAMREYYVAWTEAVLADGRFRPAFYAHTANAPMIYGDVRAVFDRNGISTEPPFWIAGGRDFGRDRDPQDVGHAFAAVWQGVLDTHERYASVRLPIDINVSAVPSPSSVQFASD